MGLWGYGVMGGLLSYKTPKCARSNAGCDSPNGDSDPKACDFQQCGQQICSVDEIVRLANPSTPNRNLKGAGARTKRKWNRSNRP